MSSLSEEHGWLLLLSCLSVPLLTPGTLTRNPELKSCPRVTVEECTRESVWMPVCSGQTDRKVEHRKRVQNAATSSFLSAVRWLSLSERDFRPALLYCPLLLAMMVALGLHRVLSAGTGSFPPHHSYPLSFLFHLHSSKKSSSHPYVFYFLLTDL